jgi:hypothetical protein
MLMLCPNNTSWPQEPRISKTTDRHPHMKRPHFKQPVNAGPTIRTKVVRQSTARLRLSAEHCIPAHDHKDSLSRVIGSNAEYAAGATLTFGAVADRNEIRRPFEADPQTTATAARCLLRFQLHLTFLFLIVDGTAQNYHTNEGEHHLAWRVLLEKRLTVDKWATAVFERTERLHGGDCGAGLVEVARISRLLRFLDFEQECIVDLASIARTIPFPNRRSSVGISFIFALSSALIALR